MITRTATIYCLTSPDIPGEVRYVGQSLQPQRRLKVHLREAAARDNTSHKLSWLRSLQEDPLLVLLEVVTADQASIAEEKWITHFIDRGHRLTNTFLKPTAPGIMTSEAVKRGWSDSSNLERNRKRSSDVGKRTIAYARSHAYKDPKWQLKREERQRIADASAARNKARKANATARRAAAAIRHVSKLEWLEVRAFARQNKPSLKILKVKWHHSEDTKKRLSEGAKRQFQTPMSAETRAKISAGHKRAWAEGRHDRERLAEMGRQTIAAARVHHKPGYKLSAETRQRLSESHKKPWSASRRQVYELGKMSERETA